MHGLLNGVTAPTVTYLRRLLESVSHLVEGLLLKSASFGQNFDVVEPAGHLRHDNGLNLS